MIYIKITNLIKANGNADYKGLDLNLIQSGTQLYQLEKNIAYVGYNGNSILHDDVTVISETDYLQEKSVVESQSNKNPITQLQEQNAQMLLALVNGGLM